MQPLMARIGRLDYTPNGLRHEPLGIIVGGSPGVGKSSLSTPFLQGLINALIPRERIDSFNEYPNSEIWQFNPEQQHSTYSGQFVTNIDDMAQSVSGSPEAQSEIMRIIRMINTAPYQQNMAGVEDKGRIWYQSHILYATTNRSHFQEMRRDITDVGAMTRRFPISVWLAPAADYCENRNVDIPLRRFRKNLFTDSSDYNPDYWEFYEWDYSIGKPVNGIPFHMNQFFDMCITKYRSMNQCSESRFRFTKTMRDFGLKKRDDGVVAQTSNYVDNFNPHLFEECMGTSIGRLKTICSQSRFKAGATLLGLLGLVSGIVWFTRGDLPVDAQSGKLTRKDDVKQTFKVTLPVMAESIAQVNISSQHDGLFATVRNRNTYMVSLAKPIHVNGKLKVSATYGVITFIRGRVAVVPAHFAQIWIDDDDASEEHMELTFSPLGTTRAGFTVRVSDLKFLLLKYREGMFRDAALMSFPDVIHQHRSILRFFPTQAERTKVLSDRSQPAILVRERTGMQALTCSATRVPHIVYRIGEATIKCAGVYSYDIACQQGDCGSLLWSASIRAGRPLILGMHIAGQEGCNASYSVDLCDDDFLHHAKMWSGETPDLVAEPIVEAQIGPQFVTLCKERTVPCVGKTSLRRTKLNNFESPLWGRPSTLAPAMLYIKDGIDPNAIARRKYSPCHSYIPRDDLDSVCSVVKNKLFSIKQERKFTASLISIEDAIMGIPGTDFKGVPRSTSPGYPFIFDRGRCPGKQFWFGDDVEYDISNNHAQQFISRIDYLITRLEVGDRPDFKYIDNLKDETVTIQKSKAGKTRLFSAAPMDLIVLQRMYFGAFVSYVKSTRVHNGCAYGVNPYNPAEWGLIALTLQSNGSNGDYAVFGDYSGYDGSLSPQLMYKVLEIINYFYKQFDPEWQIEDDIVRNTLFEDVVNSIHIAPYNNESISYQWIGSNPSGNFLTTVLNCVANLILLYLSVSATISHCLGCNFSRALIRCEEHLRVVVYGDDNGWTLPGPIMAELNLTYLSNYLASLGYSYTDEHKNPLVKYTRLSQCSLLKRSFRKDVVGYLAPLALDTIQETVLWTTSTATNDTLLKVFQDQLYELSLHGKEVFKKLAPNLVQGVLLHYDHQLVDDYELCFEHALGLESEYVKL
jgi:hypothetical protein